MQKGADCVIMGLMCRTDLKEDKQKRNSEIFIIDIIRCLACLMIFFYHCNTILPGEYRWLTFFGEDMGNQLFFMISGFALFPSVREAGFKDLPGWYFKRLIRILPMLSFFYLLSFLTGFYSFRDPAQVFTVFIYPTLYWFVTAILVFYLLLFLFLKINSRMIKGLIMAGIFALWCLRADRMEAYYLAGALSMLTGTLLRKGLERINEKKAAGILWTMAPVVFSAAYVFVKRYKFMGIRTDAPVLVAAGVLVILTGIAALTAGYLKNESLSVFFKGKEILLKIIKKTGRLALPVYMVQCFNAGIIGYSIGNRIVFPLSFFVNLIVIWGLAILTDLIFGRVSGYLGRICRAKKQG